MPSLIIYRQKRIDGGIRTGVELGDSTIFELFEPEEGDRDPTLLRYVDVRCDGPGVPGDPETAAQWLLTTAPSIQDGLGRFADKLRRVGADLDEYPLKWADFADEADVTRTISCTTIRRVDARGLAEILDDIRIHWGARVEAMIGEHAANSS